MAAAFCLLALAEAYGARQPSYEGSAVALGVHVVKEPGRHTAADDGDHSPADGTQEPVEFAVARCVAVDGRERSTARQA
jgi:hypothetical protein